MQPKTPTWFSQFEPGKQAPFRLFTLPFAGGGASIYRQWGKQLPAVEVLAVRLPGREARMSEPALTRIEDVVAQVAAAMLPYLDRPFAIFGHSLGGLVAYELSHYLREQGLPLPSCLMVSAFRAPNRPKLRRDIHQLPSSEFLRELQDYGGLPEPVLNSPELLNLILPTLRADFTVLETWRYRERNPLNCPLSAFCATDDYVVTPAEMQEWRQQTNRGFDLHELPGSHFFSPSHESSLLALIGGILRQHGAQDFKGAIF